MTLDGRWLLARLRALIGPLVGQRLCVAFSGGVDSAALLHALASARARGAYQLRALHVDHRLQSASGRWARSALAQARAWRVPCQVLRVDVRTDGSSVEAAARAARYQAMAARLHAGEWLLTAHHQDDQLETMLAALMRGSGLRGLAAMASRSNLPFAADAHGRLLRPLLELGRAQLDSYLRAHRLTAIDDPSNADERFERNFLRHKVVPLLRQRWPAASVNAARSAGWLRQAELTLAQQEGAALDLARDGAALRLDVLGRSSAEERVRLLRRWMLELGIQPPGPGKLVEMAGTLFSAREDANPEVVWDGIRVGRHDGRLFLSAAPTAVPAVPPSGLAWRWRPGQWLHLPGGSCLALKLDPHGPLRLDRIPQQLRVRYRDSNSGATVKQVLQEARIAPWLRGRVPLVYSRGQLAAVGDLWWARRWEATAGWSGMRARLCWRPPEDFDAF